MSDNAELAKLKAEMEAIKASLPKRVKPQVPDDVPLTQCNEVARRAQLEVLEEKRDAATLAKEAIDKAFAGRGQSKRVQKAISPVVAMRTGKSAT